MAELEKVIKALKRCESYGFCEDKQCPYYDNVSCLEMVRKDALELLKAQELPDVKPEKLEERTTKWLDQMTAEERLEEIAAILDDWDGYRTAKGLGGLINEVWAYALYPVKAQEPVEPYVTGNGTGFESATSWWYACGNCNKPIDMKDKFCRHCGRAVKWDG